MRDRAGELGYTLDMNSLDRIIFNPNQKGARPCIRGMRIRVRDVLTGGATPEQIVADLPDLEADDIGASLAYAAQQIGHSVIVAAE